MKTKYTKEYPAGKKGASKSKSDMIIAPMIHVDSRSDTSAHQIMIRRRKKTVYGMNPLPLEVKLRQAFFLLCCILYKICKT